MKLLRLFSFGIACAALTGFHPDAALAATFTYHGSLQDSGKPAEGSYDLELTLYTAASSGRAIGGPLVLYKVPVHAGSFSTQADFGALADVAATAWIEVRVRSAGSGEFAALSARAPVSAAETASVCPGAWTLDGNAGTSPGTGLGQNYLGTADSQPLIFVINGAQAGSLIPSGDSTYPDSANVEFGSWGNFAGAVGATVSGGGSLLALCGPSLDQPCVNSATNEFASVGGGYFNRAIGTYATVGGGSDNQATNYFATVAGGYAGVASGSSSGVLGGDGNVASGANSAVGGGYFNQAVGTQTVVSGGQSNLASGYDASVPGGSDNLAGGDYSFAAGYGAVVRAPTGTCATGTCGDYGTFVWSDSSAGGLSSSGPNQFLVHAVGGVAINTTPVNSAVELTIAASPNGIDYANLFLRQSIINAGILLSSGGATSSASNNAVFKIDQYNGTTQTHVMQIDAAGNTYNITGAWTMFSDRRLKHDIAPIEHPLDTMLALDGETFEYIDPSQAMAQPGRRMGFIAQDVEKVLPQWVGEDERGYKNVTPTGFEALSVEALRELRAEKDAEIEILQNKLDEMSARLSRLEAVREQ
jgi:hypothetical protein